MVKIKYMSDEIVKIGFYIIKDNIENDSIEDNVLLFDKFSEENEIQELMSITDYLIPSKILPKKLHRIIMQRYMTCL